MAESRGPLDLPSTTRLPAYGALIAFVGLLLRCFARSLAWPATWSYSGERSNTVWAYRESVYADLGLIALIFGLALVFLAIARATLRGSIAQTPPVSPPQPTTGNLSHQ